MSSDRDREVIAIDISSPDGRSSGQAHQARRQRPRHDARRDAARSFRGAGQRRPGRGDRHGHEHGGREDRRPRAGGLLPRGSTAGATIATATTGTAPATPAPRTFAVTLSPDGRTLYAVNAGANSIAVIPLHGASTRYRVAGPDPDRLRAARHHLQRRRRVDVHRQRQERHGPEPRHLASNTAAITSIMYPGGNAAAAAAARASNQYQFQLERASLVSAPVPNARRARAPDRAGRREQLLQRRDSTRTTQGHGVPAPTASSTSSTSSRRTAPSTRSWATSATARTATPP